jgi:hypothetical protein
VTDEDPRHFTSIAEAVRAACIDTAVRAYEDAGIRGLCEAGRWEYALAAMQRLNLAPLQQPADADAAPDRVSGSLQSRVEDAPCSRD